MKEFTQNECEQINNLKIEFQDIANKIEEFNHKIKNNENKKILKKFRNVLINQNNDHSEEFQMNLIYSIIHFLAISEINDILFALLEEMKKTLHYLIEDNTYNSNKDYYDFLLDGVLYDSSQINFNYLSALLSNTLISLVGDNIAYLICSIFNTLALILLYFLHLIDVKSEYSNEFTHLIKIFLFYIFIYTFTGIISFYPFYSMNNRFSGKNIIAINSFLFLGVLIKYIIHILLIYININRAVFYLIKICIFVICSFIYLIFHIIIFQKNKDNPYSFFISKFKYRNKSSTIILELDNLDGYLKSLINSSVKLIFVLNFFSRAQKIMFKSKYKKEYDNNWLMPINFLISYAIYLFVMFTYNYCLENKNNLKTEKYNSILSESIITDKDDEDEDKDGNGDKDALLNTNGKDKESDKIKDYEYKNTKKQIESLNEQKTSNKKKEIFIFACFFFENFLSFCFSIIYLIFDSNSIICYSSILISGSINFILTEYYSSQKIEYFSLSGIICISQIIFRLVELIYSLYKDDKWIYFQIIVSFLGSLVSSFSLFPKKGKKKYKEKQKMKEME